MKCILSQLKAVVAVVLVGYAAWFAMNCMPKIPDETEAGKPNAFITDNEKYARMMGPTPKKFYSEAEAGMPAPNAVSDKNIKFYQPSWDLVMKSLGGAGL